MANEEENRALKLLKKGIAKAERELNRTVDELEKLSKKSLSSLDGAKPVAKDIMKLADSVAKDIERTVPVIVRDLVDMERKVVSKTKQKFSRKKE